MHLPHSKQQFCSSTCRNDWQKKENHPRFDTSVKPRRCKQCGEMFRPLPSKLKEGKGKFCSQRCGWIFRRRKITLNCKVCGKEFKRKPANVKCNRNKRYFCSRKCSDKYHTGANNPFYRKHFSEESLRRILTAIKRKPSGPEKRLIQIIEERNLPYKYVGDGALVISNLVPDFVETNGQKKLIEVFGRGFHDPDFPYRFLRRPIPYHQTSEGRTKILRSAGYALLILWDDELEQKEEVIEKIEQFTKQ